jgi:hypothetical protein
MQRLSGEGLATNVPVGEGPARERILTKAWPDKAFQGSNPQEERVRRRLGFAKNEWERREPPYPHVLGII